MKTIQVTTDVFAAIWKERKPNEENENDVLERLLGCERVNIGNSLRGIQDVINPRVNYPSGFHDKRHDVHFDEGMKIFRTYKQRKYSAIATKGKWKREDTGRYYDTLNQLNESIVAGNENVWNGNWKYIDGGKNRSIDALRI